MQTINITVAVQHDTDAAPYEIAHTLRRLIDIGLENEGIAVEFGVGNMAAAAMATSLNISRPRVAEDDTQLVSALRLLLSDMESLSGEEAYGCPVEDEEHPFHESVTAARAALASRPA